MSLSNGTCLTETTIKPNITQLDAILKCQDEANTTYCYPPNGTRICVPVENIPFYWAPSYYAPDAKIALEYESNPVFIFLRNNTGNQTHNFTPYMYNTEAYPIAGVGGERSMEMYLQERRMNDTENPMNLQTHDGPTLILVKTAEFTSVVRSGIATATSTRGVSSNRNNGGVSENGKKIAAMVIGILSVLIILGVVFFFWRRRARVRSGRAAMEPMREGNTMRSSAAGRVRRRGSTESYEAAQMSLPGARNIVRNENNRAYMQRSETETLPAYQQVERDDRPPAYTP